MTYTPKSNGLIIVDELFHVWAVQAQEAMALLTDQHLLGPNHPCGGRELRNHMDTLEELEAIAAAGPPTAQLLTDDHIAHASATLKPCCNTFVLRGHSRPKATSR